MTPFSINVSDAVLLDLRDRLTPTRWPEDFANGDWRYDANGDYSRELTVYWLDRYDWRVREAQMNRLDYFRTEIDSLPIHCIHHKGKGSDPVPFC